MHRRWSVGELSKELGIAAPTLRTWERRYGVGPTFRTDGGHRRYTIVDADRVATLARLIDDGLPARAAADLVRTMPASEIAAAAADRRQTPREYALLGILGGAKALDGLRIRDTAVTVLERFGIVDGWDEVLAPALIEVGRRWETGELGVEGEHLVSTMVLEALRQISRRHLLTRPARVVSASAPDDQHRTPVAALTAALAERGHAVTELGARTPADALATFVAATDPDVVFVWSSIEMPRDEHLDLLLGLGGRTTLLLGGPGWPDEVVTSRSLRQTVDQVMGALSGDLG